MEFPSKFKIIVKTKSSKNDVLGFDEGKNAYRVNIKAKAEDNEANKEIIKFLSKTIGKRILIKSGLRSKEKIIEIM